MLALNSIDEPDQAGGPNLLGMYYPLTDCRLTRGELSSASLIISSSQSVSTNSVATDVGRALYGSLLRLKKVSRGAGFCRISWYVRRWPD